MAAFAIKIKYYFLRILFLTVFSFVTTGAFSQRLNLRRIFSDAEKQTNILISNLNEQRHGNGELLMPRTLENEKLKLVKSSDWTSGFFPGVLWQIYMYNNKIFWKERADSFTRLLEEEKFNPRTHDMGFKIFCSYGNAFKATGEQYYKDVIIHAAKTLSTRFNKNVGAIRSWDHSRDKWDFPVIIDNMMNLELLFAATKYTGDSTFYNIAVQHASTTMQNHYRPDMSSYHVIDYDSLTGKVIKRNTHQGYSHESSWARGQAWGLYGFTICYEETGIKEYLVQAESIANYLVTHPKMPKDYIPYWDFDDPAIPSVSKDASAAAIIASALLRLSRFSTTNSHLYKKTARKILYNLTKHYRSSVGKNMGFILLHSTGHAPAKSEIDVPLNYADYYYLEALLRTQRKIK